MNFCASKTKTITIVFVFITLFFSCDVFPADESCFRRCTDAAKIVVRPFAVGLTVSFLSLAGSGDPIVAAGLGSCVAAGLALWAMQDHIAARQAVTREMARRATTAIALGDIQPRSIPLGRGGSMCHGGNYLSCQTNFFDQR